MADFSWYLFKILRKGEGFFKRQLSFELPIWGIVAVLLAMFILGYVTGAV